MNFPVSKPFFSPNEAERSDPHQKPISMVMVNPTLLLRFHLLVQSSKSTSSPRAPELCISSVHVLRSHYATTTESLPKDQNNNDRKGAWFTLPPYTSAINGSALGKALSVPAASKAASGTTALKWVLRCCPELPRNLVQKLFRLRQVRRESFNVESCGPGDQGPECRLKRVGAKDSMNVGDKIFLPISVKALPAEKQETRCSEEEVNFIHSLELYKDEDIIVVNKPPGMPVQGGIGIKTSLDDVLANCSSYDCSEPPRLVHRLDRDCSGVLVMGRTQTSATVLHSIFRERTFAASDDDAGNKRRILQRKYWALVIGSPRCSMGLISAPLGKVVVDNGKSDRITVVENPQNMSSQHAVTQYRVIQSSHGFTWLELSPLTGRKHQLRVHCAAVLGTPIVGDYKYAWQAHRNWKPFKRSELDKNSNEKPLDEQMLPFGLHLDSGSISEKHPRLHLHCKQMVLPNVSKALQGLKISSDYDFSQLESLKFDAPIPAYMKKSWDILRS